MTPEEMLFLSFTRSGWQPTDTTDENGATIVKAEEPADK